MGFDYRGIVGGDYFFIQKLTLGQNDLEFYTDQFNPDDYYIYKSTRKFCEVSKTDFLDFKYGCYTFFKKELYDKNWLDLWIEWNNKNSYVLFLVKPLPPFYPQKIKIY